MLSQFLVEIVLSSVLVQVFLLVLIVHFSVVPALK
jgi:hypothetical protein